ncbi:MAG: glucosamine-6-phosphate deaminase [Parafilimonas sp.]|nr:glucosamine-6-phosphate deaminase [Parafilimonas sp.]
MQVRIYNTALESGKAAAKYTAEILAKAINKNGAANIILATGTSQFEILNQLIKADVDWNKVTMFHLDEYISLPATHAASFRKYLQERFISKVDLKDAYLINGEKNPEQERNRLNEIILKHPVDVALVGIGENGHLAFNDPPADFKTEEPYIIVELDDACRQQQMNEGWFQSIDEIPAKAISMSVKQIMKSKNIVCSVQGKRKAAAVKNCLGNSVNNLYPASILQTHTNCIIYLDKDAASLLSHP